MIYNFFLKLFLLQTLAFIPKTDFTEGRVDDEISWRRRLLSLRTVLFHLWRISTLSFLRKGYV